MKTGAQLIEEERARQIRDERFTERHDSGHEDGELARAAAAYATPEPYREYVLSGRPVLWPWELNWWKPTPNDRVRELVKAGALIAAEIDRLIAEPPKQ